MPGMRVFGRRCALATDDFFFIGAIDSIVFLPWLAWIPVIYASYLQERHNCIHQMTLTLTDISLPSLCLLFFANWVVSCLFLIFSIKGTISQPEPRRHVVSLVYIKLFISVLDVACAILGTVILVNNVYCDIIGVPLVIKVSTAFQWVAAVVRLGMVILFYDWSSCKDNTKERVAKEYFTTHVRSGTMKRWNLRLQALFLWCTTSSDARKEAIKTASELMALMSCDLDLVASDVIAGLMLYRQKCLGRWRREKAELIVAPTLINFDGTALNKFPPEDLPEWMNLQLAKRYFNIGLGAFGWQWYLYRNFSCGCCKLMPRLFCCFNCRHFTQKVLGDNCCGCALAGLQSTTNLPYEDLVHVSFVNKVFEIPFFVTYDHETKTVLVVARGSMSLNDVLTDVAAAFAPMDDAGCPPGALCHHGMLTAAREIKKKLDEKEILDKAFEEKPDYRLIVTGHSLGAAVASILTILFQEKYPDVRCFAFAPPPTVNNVTLPATYKNVFTVIYGNDSVPYLNYENVKNMVEHMVQCLESCNLPKFKVFLNYKKFDQITNNEVTNGCNEDVEAKGNVQNGSHNLFPKDQPEVEGIDCVPCVTESLYVAGTIVHIRRTENGLRLRCSKAEDYKQPLTFRPKMIMHHLPQYMQKCLEELGKTKVLDSKSLFYPME